MRLFTFGMMLSLALFSSPLIAAEVITAEESGSGTTRALQPSGGAVGESAPTSGIKSGEQNGIKFVNGGVADERQELEHMPGFNLKVTMATPGGKFNAAPLQIDDAKGKTLVDAPDAGPMFLANLPPGNYTLRVRPEHGKPMTQGVAVPSSGQKQVVFTIPEPLEQ